MWLEESEGGEVDSAGPCGHRKDVTLSGRNDTGGCSAEEWHGVTYIVNRDTLTGHWVEVEVEGKEGSSMSQNFANSLWFTH